MHRVWNPFWDRWQQLLLSCSNEANLTADSPSPELVKQGKSASGLSEGRQRLESLPSCRHVWLAFAHHCWCGCFSLSEFLFFLAHSMQQSALPLWLPEYQRDPFLPAPMPFLADSGSAGWQSLLDLDGSWLALADESVATVTRVEDWKPLADWGLPFYYSWGDLQTPSEWAWVRLWELRNTSLRALVTPVRHTRRPSITSWWQKYTCQQEEHFLQIN